MTSDPPLDKEDSPEAERPWRSGPGRLAWALIALCVLVEACLLASDWGWIGSTRWRGLAYQNGAFWAGLLDDWRPNYGAQPVTMFGTYAFLHGDIGHLIGNMATLYALSLHMRVHAGSARFAAVYGAAVLGGALCFAAMNSSPHPMVGASGAIFGLAGALVVWEWGVRLQTAERLWPVIRLVLILIALNVALWVWLEGLLAWEAHLGGFLAGALVAWLWPSDLISRPH